MKLFPKLLQSCASRFDKVRFVKRLVKTFVQHIAVNPEY